MGKKKKPKLKGAASYTAAVKERGLSTVLTDVKKKVATKRKRTATVRSAVSKARSY
jgi:hypothetical protein